MLPILPTKPPFHSPGEEPADRRVVWLVQMPAGQAGTGGGASRRRWGKQAPVGRETRGCGVGDLVKLDLKKQLKHLYLPPAKEVVLVDVPEMQFAMIDGQVEPGLSPGESPVFAEAIGALYGLSYTLKFMSKLRPVDPIDYAVMALEGLWTTPGGGADYLSSKEWAWTLMIMQPDHITAEMFAEARDKVRTKRAKEGQPTEVLDRVRLERFAEGLCVQIMHVGPYSDEPRTLERMAVFAETHGYSLRGRHHEIYLGDPRTAKPENLKTVLRHAVTETAREGS